MLALSSLSRVAAAIERARSVTLVAYLLPRGTIVDALADAARRGARVTVRLEGKPYFDSSGGVARLNRAVVDVLARAGADARLVDDDGTKPQLHAKAVLVDGTLYLDDVNFARSGTILRDDRRADARALRDAVADRIDPPSRSFALRKVDALRLEAAALDAARRRDRIEVETESAGSGNAVYARLERLGRAGLRPRLLVSREALTTKERSVLHRLQSSLPEPKRRMLQQLYETDPIVADRKVLIVDDDVRNIFALSSVLERRGMTVLTAGTGREAIATIESTSGASWSRDRPALPFSAWSTFIS